MTADRSGPQATTRAANDLGGPGATARATAAAMARVEGARALVLVEGISDQIAVEAAAAGRGRDLAAERVVVVPIGGAHAVRRFLSTLEPVRVVGLCDRPEEGLFRRELPADDLFVCDADLEDELIRAVGAAAVEALFEAHGDLGAFRSMSSQPAWRGRDAEARMRRFLGSGSGRKLRYARVLVEAALRREALPAPLERLLAAV